MLIPYFCDDDNWLRYKEELLSWIGTPYRHYQRAKGYGADCTMFVASCMINIGLLTHIDYEYYSKDWHLHTDNPVVENGIIYNFNKNVSDKSLKFYLVLNDFTEYVRGDMILIWTTKPTLTNHCSVIFEDGVKMIHSINHAGVEVTDYVRWWKRHTRYKLRVYREV